VACKSRGTTGIAVLAFWILALSTATGIAEYRVDSKRFPGFFRYFEPADTIRFDPSRWVVGEITFMAALDSACAVFDMKAKSLLYVDLAKDSTWTLTFEDSLPGVPLMIMGIEPCGRDAFAAAIDPSWVVIFGPKGVRRVFNLGSHRATFLFATGPDAVFLLENPEPGHLHITRLDLRTGRTRVLFGLPEVDSRYPNLIFRSRQNGGLLFDAREGFFVANGFENVIYNYSPAGKLVRKLRSWYKNFQGIQRDAPDPSPASVFSAFMKRGRHLDLVDRIFNLTSSTILATYAVGGKARGELFDKRSGRSLIDRELTFPLPVKWAGSGCVYLVYPLAESGDDEVGNPSLLVFRLKEEVDTH